METPPTDFNVFGVTSLCNFEAIVGNHVYWFSQRQAQQRGCCFLYQLVKNKDIKNVLLNNESDRFAVVNFHRIGVASLGFLMSLMFEMNIDPSLW